jgi:hypothetical protein
MEEDAIWGLSQYLALARSDDWSLFAIRIYLNSLGLKERAIWHCFVAGDGNTYRFLVNPGSHTWARLRLGH